MTRFNYFRNQQSGFILILTLLCALILTGVMMSTMFISTKGQKVVKNFKESVQTLNAADAAIKQAKGALNAYLATEQVGTGALVDFTKILEASASAGALVIDGDSTDWGNLQLLGNTVVVTAYDDEGSSDSDRIIVLQAEATSATRQRVRIKSHIQAPSETNTSVPDFVSSVSMCSDTAGLRQELIVKTGNSLVSGFNHLGLPAWGCSGATCYVNTTNPADPYNMPPAVLSDDALQTVTVSGGAAAITGSPATVQNAPDGTNCANLRNFVDQLASLSDSLDNVIVSTDAILTSADLGTRDSPKITIVRGAAGTARRDDPLIKKVTTANNTKGAGILLIQTPTYTTETGLDWTTGTNFYYEGLIILYGDDNTVFTTKGTETLYGGMTVLTGGEGDTLQRATFTNSSRMLYSTWALGRVDQALGSVSLAEPITTVEDPRNQVITVGWYEEYGI